MQKYTLLQHGIESVRRECALHQLRSKNLFFCQRKRAEKAERVERAEKEKLTKAVHAFLAIGKDISFIAGVLDLSVEEINNLAQ